MKRLLPAVIFAVACSGSSRLVAQEAGQGPRLAPAIKGLKTRRRGTDHPGIPSRVSDIVFG